MKYRVFIPGSPDTFKNYAAAIQAAGAEPCFHCSAEECHALLLPGGEDIEPWRYGQPVCGSVDMKPERDAMEFSVLERFFPLQRPILGICRGLQLINVFLGGTLVQDLPGHRQSGGFDRLHRSHSTPSLLTSLYEQGTILNSAHHQAIDRLGSGLTAVQWTPDGVIEAVVHKDLPIYALQWHPERMRGPFAKPGTADGDLVFQAFLSLCKS